MRQTLRTPKKFLIILLSIFALANFTKLYAEDPKSAYQLAEESFQEFAAEMQGSRLDSLRFQLITATPGKTVTTAFGHIALRAFSGNECGPYDSYTNTACTQKDFYIDFGQYDESASFLWRFLRGHARFYAHVLPMAAAFQGWEASGRGLFAQDLKLTRAQKRRVLDLILESSDNFTKSYDYANFTRNCVTFIRDILGEAVGAPLQLEDLDKYTWRSRVTRYTRTLFWLRINEKLLFDRDTDRERSGPELIFTPYDLQKAVVQAELVEGDVRQLLPDRWPPADSSFTVDDVAFYVAVFILLSQLTSGPSRILQIWANRTLAIAGTIAGVVVWFVWLFTQFEFMDETIMILAFTPLDFLLWKNPFQNSPRRLLLYFGAARLVGVLGGIALLLTTHPQSVGSIFSFLLVFFTLYTYRRYSELRQSAQSTAASE
ncbi:MAG: DUF4105 domain-containing protein [bacterium]|nr:DUF4105 domain-containing protein [bacterium]